MNQTPSGNSSAAALHLLDHEASPDRVLDFVKELRPEERQSGEVGNFLLPSHFLDFEHGQFAAYFTFLR